MSARSLTRCLLTFGALVAGCSQTSPDEDSPSASGRAGQTTGTGGSSNVASGGMAATAHGGTGTGGTGGAGAVPGAGGTALGSGGSGGSGANTGGAAAAGGAPVGGAPAQGGTPGSGGTLPDGTGGAAGKNTGGAATTGGMAGAGGVSAGGAAGSRGTALGGRSGSGGAGAGMAGMGSVEMCTPGSHASAGTQHCGMSDTGTADGNYTYNIYSDGKGSGCMTTYGVDATFSATWTNVGDWIARVGLAFDKTKTYDKIGVFSSDFSYTMTGITTGGFGNVGVYGWSVNPLHEYYIIENWLGKKPAFTVVGSFTIDGEGTYEIQTNTQNNQPNITGTNATFVQFWSVRSEPRQCGHISISKHFDEWKSLGLTLGNLEEARILVEAQNNSGSMDFTTATVVVK